MKYEVSGTSTAQGLELRRKAGLGVAAISAVMALSMVMGFGPAHSSIGITQGAPTGHASKHGKLISPASSQTITIQDGQYVPLTLTVHVGDTVTWSNTDDVAHTANSTGFSSGVINVNQTFSHQFNTAGTFSIHCTLHSDMNNGTITVLGAAATSTPQPAPTRTAVPPTATLVPGQPTYTPAPATSTPVPGQPTATPAPGSLPNTGNPIDTGWFAIVAILLLLVGGALTLTSRRRTS